MRLHINRVIINPVSNQVSKPGSNQLSLSGVDVLGGDVGNDALEYFVYSFRCPGYLELRKAVGDPRGDSFTGAGLAIVATRV